MDAGIARYAIDKVFDLARKRAILYAAAGFGVLATYAYKYRWSKQAVLEDILQTFEAGGKPGWQERYPADFKKGMIDRSVLVKKLQEVVGGTNDKYVLIEGATGTGKSTAVRQAVSGMQGAVYFMCPVNAVEFSQKVCQALGVRSGMGPRGRFDTPTAWNLEAGALCIPGG